MSLDALENVGRRNELGQETETGQSGGGRVKINLPVKRGQLHLLYSVCTFSSHQELPISPWNVIKE